MTSTYDAIAERIWTFLQTAMAGREPDRDILTSESILHDLVRAMPSDPSDEAGWADSCRAAISVSSRCLAAQPNLWPTAVELTSVYLSTDWEPAHPRADRTISRGQVGQVKGPVYPVRLHLDQHLIRELFANATPPERRAFLGSLKSWSVALALQEVLPDLKLDGEDVVALLVAIERFAANDMAKGGLLGAVAKWSQRNPTLAIAVVEAWLVDGESLSSGHIQCLTEGAVQGSNDLKWRDSVLERLEALPSEDAWKLAAVLAFRAWPNSNVPDVTHRHEALVQRILRLPERLVPTGIWAMKGDASKFPREAVSTALKLYDMLPRTVDGERRLGATLELANVLWLAASHEKARAGDLQFVVIGLDRLLLVPADQRSFTFGALLAKIVDTAEGAVQGFLGRWLLLHRPEIDTAQVSLRDLFTLLVDANTQRVDGWLIDWMSTPSPDLQVVAEKLFDRRGHAGLPADAVMSLTDDRATALAYVLASSASIEGSVWVPALVELGLLRPHLIDAIQELLAVDAVNQYPGVLQNALARWIDSPHHLQARQLVEGRLHARQREWEAKREVPEFPALRPSIDEWMEWQQRTMNEAVRAAEKRSPFLSMITKMPIARGEGTSDTGDPSECVPFSSFEISSDLPLLDLMDPIAAKRRRLNLRSKARQFLKDASLHS